MPSEDGAGAATSTSNPRHYVFVDEYNRHKRLKVMRACDGCRKRKIRCDGALQNGPWPCGACVRLKLKCVPPSLDQEDEDSSNEPEAGKFTFQTATFATTSSTRQNAMDPHPQVDANWASSATSGAGIAVSAPLDHSLDSTLYSTELFPPQQMPPRLDRSFSDDDYLGTVAQEHFYPTNRAGPTERPHGRGSLQTVSSDGDPEEVEAAVKGLSDQMSDLAIDHLAVAPWIRNQQRAGDAPTTEDTDVLLPPSVLTDPTIRIPPEMMPDDARCMDYFGYFFTYIHPYNPVLNRKRFYDQWRNSRHTISPLLLEGIFATVAQYLEDFIAVRRWLALASRHEESFKDVPRLSTIQAMLLLTKAREYVPKRGYYYRSWMSVKYMITMAVDLGLNEHYDKHRFGDSCKMDKADCLIEKRIWQSLFCLELLVGAPQGRTDFSVELSSVDFSLSEPSPDVEMFEHQTSRRATFMAKCIRNIKLTNQMWQSMRHQKTDWALDPSFQKHNDDLVAFLAGLPPDVQITYNDDGLPPFKIDHFVAYIHIYHHLVVIMHHRPQLQTLIEKRDPSWRIQLDVCLQASMRMCQLQEALLQHFGLHGLQFMIRGINFSIYCVLTCTMLHLAAITSPEPATNITARGYFTRHMRVLEHCVSSAAPEMQAQINALREAFSADTSKPFELKPTLGLRSPSVDDHATPPSMQHGGGNQPIQSAAVWATQMPDGLDPHKAVASHSPSFGSNPYDPGSAAAYASNAAFTMPPDATFAGAPLHPHHHPQHHQQQQQIATTTSAHGYALEPQLSNDAASQPPPPVWDPSGIFSHWNHAFGGGPPPAAVAGAAAPAPQAVVAATTTTTATAVSPTGMAISPQQQQMLAQQQQQLSTPTSTSTMPSTPHQVQHHSSNNGGNMYNPQMSRQANANKTSPLQQQHQQHLHHQQQQQPQPQQQDAAMPVQVMPTVTPNMWQDVFTNAYVSGHGQKRYRGDEDVGVGYEGYSNSKRRG